jgi:hypothetical protein
MADKSQHDESKGKEAIVGVRADVKSIQQLSSSAKAAQDKRHRIKNEKALRLLDEAVQQGLERENQQSSSRGPNQ